MSKKPLDLRNQLIVILAFSLGIVLLMLLGTHSVNNHLNSASPSALRVENTSFSSRDEYRSSSFNCAYVVTSHRNQFQLESFSNLHVFPIPKYANIYFESPTEFLDSIIVTPSRFNVNIRVPAFVYSNYLDRFETICNSSKLVTIDLSGRERLNVYLLKAVEINILPVSDVLNAEIHFNISPFVSDMKNMEIYELEFVDSVNAASDCQNLVDSHQYQVKQQRCITAVITSRSMKGAMSAFSTLQQIVLSPQILRLGPSNTGKSILRIVDWPVSSWRGEPVAAM